MPIELLLDFPLGLSGLDLEYVHGIRDRLPYCSVWLKYLVCISIVIYFSLEVRLGFGIFLMLCFISCKEELRSTSLAAKFS